MGHPCPHREELVHEENRMRQKSLKVEQPRPTTASLVSVNSSEYYGARHERCYPDAAWAKCAAHQQSLLALTREKDEHQRGNGL
jgi:hypothetical protein